MTKQYRYEEYKKLSDAVRDWENGEQVHHSFIKCSITDKNWSEWQEYPSKSYCIDNDTVPDFDFTDKYAKRVEIKEKTTVVELIHHMGSFNGEALMINVSDDFMQKFKGGAIKIKSASITWIEISEE